MPRINWLKNLREAVWTVLEADSEISTIIDGKFLHRPILRDDFEPGKAPFLAGWIITPDREWWTQQADQFTVGMMFFAAVNSGDREDFDDVELLFIGMLEALRLDLCDPSGVLRTSGGIYTFDVEGSSFGYFEDIRTDEGATFYESTIEFKIRNPNATGSP